MNKAFNTLLSHSTGTFFGALFQGMFGCQKLIIQNISLRLIKTVELLLFSYVQCTVKMGNWHRMSTFYFGLKF